MNSSGHPRRGLNLLVGLLLASLLLLYHAQNSYAGALFGVAVTALTMELACQGRRVAEVLVRVFGAALPRRRRRFWVDTWTADLDDPDSQGGPLGFAIDIATGLPVLLAREWRWSAAGHNHFALEGLPPGRIEVTRVLLRRWVGCSAPFVVLLLPAAWWQGATHGRPLGQSILVALIVGLGTGGSGALLSVITHLNPMSGLMSPRRQWLCFSALAVSTWSTFDLRHGFQAVGALLYIGSSLVASLLLLRSWLLRHRGLGWVVMPLVFAGCVVVGGVPWVPATMPETATVVLCLIQAVVLGAGAGFVARSLSSPLAGAMFICGILCSFVVPSIAFGSELYARVLCGLIGGLVGRALGSRALALRCGQCQAQIPA